MLGPCGVRILNEKDAMPRLIVTSPLSPADAAAALKRRLPLPTTGSWPEYERRAEAVDPDGFQVLVKLPRFPFAYLVTGSWESPGAGGAIRVTLHRSTWIGLVIGILAVPLPLTGWLWFDRQPGDPSTFWILMIAWGISLMGGGVVWFEAWWHSTIVADIVRDELKQHPGIPTPVGRW